MRIESSEACQNRSIIKLKTSQGLLMLFGIAENIIRCVYTKQEEICLTSPLGIWVEAKTVLQLRETKNAYIIATGRVCLEVEKSTGHFTWRSQTDKEILLREAGKELSEHPLMIYTTGEDEPIINRVQTVDGERNFVENLKPVMDHMAYRGKIYFRWKKKEKIHGLGQGEEGIYNYRGNVQYLYQHNMRIPIPFFLSDQNYGILADCGSLMSFNDDNRGSYLYFDTAEQIDYYFIAGETADEIIAGYRTLTGKAVILPKWAYGYVQSKEAYHTQEELVKVAEEYRKRRIGLDCVVQDWNTWEDGAWGNKIVDKRRYPNLAEMNQKLHDMHVHSMVSVWPNMNAGTDNYEEMQAAGYLLNDYATYDAFDEGARELYWKQAEKELFSGGFDSWWCDSTEPFSGPDWNGEFLREPWERFCLVGNEHNKFLRADRANLYAAAHAKGIYENQRKAAPKKRVLNLTRAGYASIQKYGTMLWSGDIKASWKTLKCQITEGLNMALSGVPYWTLDIGAFFTVNEKWQNRGCGCNKDSSPKWFWRGDYEEGVNDYGYRELYVRWFEFAAFLPMFRSHGTDTPREVWNFGNPGEMFYDALVSTIQLRYRLMPYIYSMAGKVWLKNDTMMRPLLFDFPNDAGAALDSEYMFGESLLICPVTDPMYYKRESRKLEKDKTWNCYLPGGTYWYDFHTEKYYEGGRNVDIQAEIDRIPVFVRAGAIIPMEKQLQYAQEAVDTALEIHIYPGGDGEYELYEDAGDDYGYEEGHYNLISMSWNDEKQELAIGSSAYDFPQSIRGRKCIAVAGEKCKEFVYQGEEVRICL